MIPVTDRLAIDEDEIEEVFVRARSQIMRRWFYMMVGRSGCCFVSSNTCAVR